MKKNNTLTIKRSTREIKHAIDILTLTPKEKMTPDMETQLNLYKELFYNITSTSDQDTQIAYILTFQTIYDLYNGID